MSSPLPPALAEAVALTKDLVDPELRKAVDRLDSDMRWVCSYHMGWTDAGGAPSGGGGKGLRPTLVLLAAAACGGDPADGVPAAVAVELVHNFSLVHDDVMDRDVERRHQPTAWVTFGVPAAVLAGDALVTLALGVVLGRGGPDGADGADVAAGNARLAGCLVDAVAELVAGQSADLAFEGRTDVTLEEGIAMAAGKTAALMGCSAAMGAMSVDAPLEQEELLAAYGRHLGAAFQLVDDVLGIWGDPATTGKPALADIRSRKKSLPVLAAASSDSRAGERVRSLYARPEPFEEGELARVAEAVEAAGGRVWAEREADRELCAALRCVDRLDAPEPAADGLRALADYVVRRDR